jgi:poly(hydroxyalkanoate) granule-associated protein
MRRLCLAALGTCAILGDAGLKLWDTVVSRGRQMEVCTHDLTGQPIGAVLNQVDSVVDVVKERAIDTWEGMEQWAEDRVARVLQQAGIPTREDVGELTARVMILHDEVKALLRKAS